MPATANYPTSTAAQPQNTRLPHPLPQVVLFAIKRQCSKPDIGFSTHLYPRNFIPRLSMFFPIDLLYVANLSSYRTSIGACKWDKNKRHYCRELSICSF